MKTKLRFAVALLSLVIVLLMPMPALANGGLLLVANQGDHTISILDPDAGTTVAKITTPEIRVHEISVSPDGKRAYLPVYGDSGVGLPGTDGQNIEVLDIHKREITSTIALGHPVRPHWTHFGADHLLYVSAELDKAVNVFDPASGKLIASIPTDQAESHMVALSSDGKRAYTANVGPGTVSVLDLGSRKLVTVIPIAPTVQRIAISVDDKFVFTSDQKQPRMAVIDTSTNKIAQWIELPSLGYGSAPTSDGKYLLVTLPGANQVAVVDLALMRMIRTIPVSAHPGEVLIRPDQSAAYVSCTADGKVSVIDLKEWRVTKTLDSGPGADGLAWAPK